MCGFLASFGGRPLSAEQIKLGLNQLKSRGPDEQTQLSQDNFTLIHTRLAIQERRGVDSQPYELEKRFYLIYNGEIYNYKELRHELEREGIKFSADGDTEVLIRGLIHYGVGFIKRLNGMFSFVFFDREKNEVIFARDRLGIKPLYYHLSDSLQLSTNSKLLANINQLQINEAGLEEVLSFRYGLRGKSIYRNVEVLPPAHYGVWHGERVRLRRYWELPSAEKYLGEIEYQEEFDHLLKESIRLRTIAKVPVTTLLSGGLDSSFIALEASRLGVLREAFTLKLKDNHEDYRRAETIARQASLTHTLIAEGADPYFWAKQWDEALKLSDEPTVDNIIGATHLLFKEIGGRYKVVLTGEGADELLGGYVHHSLIKKIERILPLVPRSLYKIAFPILWNFARFLSPYPGSFSRSERAKLALFLSEKNPARAVEILLSLVSKLKFETSFEMIKKTDFKNVWRFDFQHWLPNYSLRRLDQIGAGLGVEARVPYLDHKLVEFVFSHHEANLWSTAGDKAPLRAAHVNNFQNYGLSEQKKTPFLLSAKDALTPDVKNLISECLLRSQDKFEAIANFCSENEIHRLINDSAREPSPLEVKRIFSVYLTARWLEGQN